VPKVFFHYINRTTPLRNKKRIKFFIQEIFKCEKIRLVRLQYIFCSDAFLLKINKKFLNHSFYTDILTFNLNGRNQDINGEIYISIDRVKENAALFKTTFKEELLRVLIHGALHLCGYNDVTRIEIKKMRRKEEYYLQMFHVKHL
jgi:probable rRNA maturation factor